jgi:hypothetical protein
MFASPAVLQADVRFSALMEAGIACRAFGAVQGLMASPIPTNQRRGD